MTEPCRWCDGAHASRRCPRFRSAPRRAEYVPLDEQLEAAPMRVLRVLRFFDWVDGRELLDACGAPECQSVERNTLTSAMSRMHRSGEIERRRVVLGRQYRAFQGVMFEFRITDKGRRRVASTTDGYEQRFARSIA